MVESWWEEHVLWEGGNWIGVVGRSSLMVENRKTPL